jgi:metallophosphoesterase superfamily enzyme
MGHLHPSIVLKDEMAIKSEKYKCFLKGKHKKKEFIVLPSFLGMTEGLALNEFNDEKAKGYDFSLIPQKELKNFEVFIVPELGDEALSFGKVKSIN